MTVVLAPLTAELAERVATWFTGDPDGQRQFGDFYARHPTWWTLVQQSAVRRAWVGVTDELPDGVGFVDCDGDDAVHVALYVRPELRGRGLSTALARAALSQAQDVGASSVVAEVAPDNAPSLALCRRAGLEEVGTNEHGEVVLRLQLVTPRKT